MQDRNRRKEEVNCLGIAWAFSILTCLYMPFHAPVKRMNKQTPFLWIEAGSVFPTTGKVNWVAPCTLTKATKMLYTELMEKSSGNMHSCDSPPALTVASKKLSWWTYLARMVLRSLLWLRSSLHLSKMPLVMLLPECTVSSLWQSLLRSLQMFRNMLRIRLSVELLQWCSM